MASKANDASEPDLFSWEPPADEPDPTPPTLDTPTPAPALAPAVEVHIEPCDPSVTDAPAVRRLSRQSLAILERLQQGPCTNKALAVLALKYTGRVSDLRKAGWDVRVWVHDHATGMVWYGLGARPPGWTP